MGIWEMLSLSRLQKTLKFGDSLSGTCAQERKPRMWLDNILLVPLKVHRARREELKPQRAELRITEDYFQARNQMEFSWLNFKIAWEW